MNEFIEDVGDARSIIRTAARELHDKLTRVGVNVVGLQIVASVDVLLEDEFVSKVIDQGSGNFHARRGAVEEWIETEKARGVPVVTTCAVEEDQVAGLIEELDDDDDDGDVPSIRQS